MPFFSAYHELQSSTSVEACAWVPLLPGNVPQLVILRRSVIDVYEVGTAGVDADAGAAAEAAPSAQLRLLATFPLAEPAADLKGVVLRGRAARAAGGAGRASVGALLLSFRDARVSLIALDAGTLRLVTLAMLDFDERGVGAGAGGLRVRAPRAHPTSAMALSHAMRVDADGRAVAFQPVDDTIVVMPLASEDALELGGDTWAGDAAAPIAAGSGGGGATALLTRSVFERPFCIDLATLSGAGGDGVGGLAGG
jgi:hypothetical protein